MRSLLTVTTMLELGAGLALVVIPSVMVTLLLGEPLEGPAALTVARVGGAGLTALAAACWLARGDTPSRAARGLVAAMLLYNMSAVGILTYAGLGYGLFGIGLWPGVALHAAMAVWCVACLRRP